MFSTRNDVEQIKTPHPPSGVDELLFRVFDEKQRLHHSFRAASGAMVAEDEFQLLNDPARAFESCILREAVVSHRPVTASLSFGEGRRKYLLVLPYERKWGKWRYACLQVTPGAPDPTGGTPVVCAMAGDRACLLMVDSSNQVRAASSVVPQSFGYTSEQLVGMQMRNLFSEIDLGIVSACSTDTNEPILGCVLHGLGGIKLEVEVRKYSVPDHYTLYGICDMTPPRQAEDVSQVGMRERRRIGQDLHDSIGQLLTGISLLSRSLANSLGRDGNPDEADAAQISELADEASNQIRQISRGLMPSEIVNNGLFASLRELARTTTASCALACEAVIDESLSVGDRAVETHLYRIAQEAVNNAVRHAGASRIQIAFSRSNGMPQLEVQDNGSWKETNGGMAGIGMKTMEYRASAIGGQLKIGSGEQGGTRVVCMFEADELMATKA